MPDYDEILERFEDPIKPASGTPFIPEQNTGDFEPVPERNREHLEEEEKIFGAVRFLNASTGNAPLNILIDNHVYASALEFTMVTPYGKIEDGFHNLTVSSAMNPRDVYYYRKVPFVKGEPVTMVIVEDMDGIEVVSVADRASSNNGEDNGCFRAANMSYDRYGYDIMFYSGDVVFANVRFKETTFFKQAKAHQYEFFVSRAVTGMEREELPVIQAKEVASQLGVEEPLYWFSVDVRAHKKYTAFIIGNTWSLDTLRVLVVEGP